MRAGRFSDGLSLDIETPAPPLAPAARTLRITEIFFSIQGEARSMGWPTVFVRLTGCPLRCGYCDSAYAFHGGSKHSLQALWRCFNTIGIYSDILSG